jgi:hypothetical protein
MSVWPSVASHHPALAGENGELVSVRVCVDPRLLEKLLEALSYASFPINPQIYHKAGFRRLYPDGRSDLSPTTLVEFPAYSGHLPEMHEVLSRYGFPVEAVFVRSMLEDIQENQDIHPAPKGTPYHAVVITRQMAAPA